MAGTDERLRCWAAGAQVTIELESAIENSRHMLDLLQQGVDPNSSTTFRTEAANYSLHLGAVEEGVREAERCGETPIDLSWIGEFRRLHGKIRGPPSNEPDAHGQFDALDSVLDWLRRDTAGIPEPSGATEYAVYKGDSDGEIARFATEDEAGDYILREFGDESNLPDDETHFFEEVPKR